MNKSTTIIEANKPIKGYWLEFFQYKDLLFFLAWRDFKVRYKQTLIGVSWAVLRPLLTMTIFTIIFGKVAKLPTEGDAPYAIMVFSAMLPWYFFASATQDSSQSLVNKASMVSKLYFPRIIIPISPLFVNAIDLLISGCILLVLMLIYQYSPSYRLLYLPIFFIPLALIVISCGIWISALNVKYRDFRYIVPFVIQLGLFVSPVGFSSRVIPEQWKLLYSLNPMVGIIDGFRWCILNEPIELYAPAILSSIVWPILLLFFGIKFFRRAEQQFADII